MEKININSQQNIKLEPIESVENSVYTVKANLKVDDYYKQTDLRGIDIRDVNKIKEVANKTNTWYIALREVILAIASAALSLFLNNIFTGFSWDNPKDIICFFVTLIVFVIFIAVYIFMCYKEWSDKNKLIGILQEHLFTPLGMKEGEDDG